MQKIVPNLWFNGNAEEAVRFYVGIFKKSRIGRITRYGEEGYEIHHMKAGAVQNIQFWLEGQEYIAINAGPEFKFNEAVSFMIKCRTREELDYYWGRLAQGGDPKAQICGWLKDQYGLSWQVVPAMLAEMLADPEPQKAGRVMKALLAMKKIDWDALEMAYHLP